MPKNGKLANDAKNSSGEESVLVEFKAPKELVDAFDLKLKSRFSSRSETIRALMRMFIGDSGKDASGALKCEDE